MRVVIVVVITINDSSSCNNDDIAQNNNYIIISMKPTVKMHKTSLQKKISKENIQITK